MRGRFWRLLSIMTALLGLASAQSMDIKDLGAGKLLVAPRDAPDPRFAETVILLVSYERDGVLGLAINRPTDVPVSQALQGLKGAGNRTDPVYVGGPVEIEAIMGLLRSHTKPSADATSVFSDLYLVSSKSLIEKTLAGGTDNSQFRIYVGYCGWTYQQLQDEMKVGAWYIFDGNAGMVFDAHPDSVWRRLINRTERQIALGRSEWSVAGGR